MAHEAYGTFRHPAVAPLAQLAPDTFVLELFHGPTLAFKDLAMQFLARLMDHALVQRGERTTIVVATSGDTGGAAVEAFRGRDQVDLIVLFPHGRISDVQRRMMTTPAEPNVHALAIEGTFDDCQAIVKGLFNHHAFRDRVRLSGVNSINWARIVAQVVYYFTAAVALGAPHRKVAFTVPTGNFGDVFAGYVAQRMGLPVERLVVATNVNDILVRTLATGTYEVRDVMPTASPSMDIQVSSNFERLLFDAYGRDPGAGARADGLARAIAAASPSRRRARPRSARASPPTAPTRTRPPRPSAPCSARPATCSIRTPPSPLRSPRRKPAIRSVPMVVLSTAHPAKFPDAVEAACGVRPALPDWLADLDTRPERVTVLPADQGAVEKFILAASRAAREGAAA